MGASESSTDGPEVRARRAAAAGHQGDQEMAQRLAADPDPRVRTTALGALARIGILDLRWLGAALSDPDAGVRRRACELAVAHPEADLLARLADEPAVAEMAAWALGERGDVGAVGDLSAMATGHADPLCRESAVAALGAIGSPTGLPAILAAGSDRPAVRRRAVIALAPFEGPEVDAALERARQDRDWQVRQAAEDLT